MRRFEYQIVKIFWGNVPDPHSGYELPLYNPTPSNVKVTAEDVMNTISHKPMKGMLSHLLVHLPPLPSRSQIALFSMPRLISGINFHLHFMNQFHLFMLTSIHPSLLHFPHLSPLHSFTLNSKLTSLVNHFPHRSLTIDISDWLPRLMGPFSVFTVFVGVTLCSWCGRQN